MHIQLTLCVSHQKPLVKVPYCSTIAGNRYNFYVEGLIAAWCTFDTGNKLCQIFLFLSTLNDNCTNHRFYRSANSLLGVSGLRNSLHESSCLKVELVCSLQAALPSRSVTYFSLNCLRIIFP